MAGGTSTTGVEVDPHSLLQVRFINNIQLQCRKVNRLLLIPVPLARQHAYRCFRKLNDQPLWKEQLIRPITSQCSLCIVSFVILTSPTETFGQGVFRSNVPLRKLAHYENLPKRFCFQEKKK